jgi:hypothetical protein
MHEFNFYEARIAKNRMMTTDHLSPEKWLAHAETLSAEQIQREMLRQATDTKLQLISILNTLHLAVVCFFTMIVLLGGILWRMW